MVKLKYVVFLILLQICFISCSHDDAEETEEIVDNKDAWEEDAFALQSENEIGNLANSLEEPPQEAPKQEIVEQTQDLEGDSVKNYEDYNKHFASFFGGHAEGAFIVRIKHCPIYNAPSLSAEVLGYLDKGNDVFAQGREGDWVKIGKYQYIEFSNLQNLGLTTGKYPLGYFKNP